MGLLDDAKKKLTAAVDQHGDKIAGGIDKAAAAVDKKTGGKYADKIEKGSAKAKDALDAMDKKNDDIPDTRDPKGPTQP